MFIYDVSKDGFESSYLKMTATDSRHMLHTIHVIFALIGLFVSFLPDYREKYCISVIDLDINLEHFGKL